MQYTYLYRTSHIVREICENFCCSVAPPNEVSKPKYNAANPYYLERDNDDFVVTRPCAGRRYKAKATDGLCVADLIPPTGTREVVHGNHKHASVETKEKEGFPFVKVEFGNNKSPWCIAKAS